MNPKIIIRESDMHHHLKARMDQRGIALNKIEITLNEGFDAQDAKDGTCGKVYVFGYNALWEGKYFEEKEVAVYYRYKDRELVLLTAKARYGKGFYKGER